MSTTLSNDPRASPTITLDARPLFIESPRCAPAHHHEGLGGWR